MKYVSQFITRCTAPFSSSSPFHRRIKRTEDRASGKQLVQPAEERQPNAGPSAEADLQLNDLLAEPFRKVRTPLAETNEDGVVDNSVCYAMDCQICEPGQHECQALLRTWERVLTVSDGSFGFAFPCGGAPSVVEDCDSSSSREEDERGVQAAGRKERKKGKGQRSKAKAAGRWSSGWSKIRSHLSHLFPHKSAPNLATRNASPRADGVAPAPSEPRFAKRFARLRHARRKPTAVDL